MYGTSDTFQRKCFVSMAENFPAAEKRRARYHTPVKSNGGVYSVSGGGALLGDSRPVMPQFSMIRHRRPVLRPGHVAGQRSPPRPRLGRVLAHEGKQHLTRAGTSPPPSRCSGGCSPCAPAAPDGGSTTPRFSRPFSMHTGARLAHHLPDGQPGHGGSNPPRRSSVPASVRRRRISGPAGRYPPCPPAAAGSPPTRSRRSYTPPGHVQLRLQRRQNPRQVKWVGVTRLMLCGALGDERLERSPAGAPW